MIINHLDRLFVTNDAATMIQELEVRCLRLCLSPSLPWIKPDGERSPVGHLTLAANPARWTVDDVWCHSLGEWLLGQRHTPTFSSPAWDERATCYTQRCSNPLRLLFLLAAILLL